VDTRENQPLVARRRRELSAGQAVVIAVAVGALAAALQIRDGTYHPAALALVGLGLLAVLAVVLGYGPRLGERGLAGVLAALVLAEMLLLALQPVALHMELGPLGRLPLYALLGLVAALVALFAAAPPCLSRFRLPAILLLVVVHLVLGVWILNHSPIGGDVYYFQWRGARALLNGLSPYATPMRNIYHPYEGFYGPGLVKDGWLQFGCLYMPLPLLPVAAAIPLGDIRYAHLAALSLAGGLLAALRPGRVAPLAAALLLFNPRFGLVLQYAWTEPFVILFLVLAVFASLHAPRMLILSLGLLFASKQYPILIGPALVLLVNDPINRRWRTFRLVALGGAIAVGFTLPFALMSLPGFFRSIVVVQFLQPFRMDALSFLVPVAGLGGAWLLVVPAVLTPLALVLALRRLPRSPAGFASTVGFTFLVFFAFNKQAFCNYYFFVVGALCTALASVDLDAVHNADAPPARPEG
jgi:hypothetical protein